jgi:multiple sugar transport system substrate-binding protein
MPTTRRDLARLAAAVTLAAPGLAAPAIARAQGRTLALWHVFNLETEAYMREGVRSWNAANPNLRIEERIIPFAQYRTELVRAIATGETPDLCVIDNPDTPSFSAQNQLTDLSARVAASANIKADKYLPGPWSTTQWRGHTYAIPRDSNTIALYLNHEMFRAAGLDPAKPPATWAEVVETAKKLASADGRVVGIMFSARAAEDATFQWLPWLWQAGADIDKLDTPEAAAALQVWVELVSSGAASRDVLTVSQSEGTNRLISGNAAMAISGPWDTPRVSQQARFEWSVAPLPVRGIGQEIRASALGGWNWAIPQGSKNPDAAWRVIEHMSQPEIMRNSWVSGRLAPRTDVTVENPAYPQAFAAYSEQMKVARARGPHPRWPDLSRPVQQAIQQALSGQASAEAALRTAAGVIRPILAQVPLRG